MPCHFCWPTPNTEELAEDHFSKESILPGIDINLQHQLVLLRIFRDRFYNEYCQLPVNRTSIPWQYYLDNGAFNSIDGEILYCMIRHFKPQRVYEIGSGSTTYLSAQALLVNDQEQGTSSALYAIDPYPNDVLTVGFPGLTELITSKVQEVPLAFFGELGENDILFIDSSHVLKEGSDVQYEYLELLPRLKKGVVVHVHDIFFPNTYPRDWILEKHFFWNEQYILQAFLNSNSSFSILWMGNYIHKKYPSALQDAFPSYDPKTSCPGSFWMQKTH